MHVEKITYKDFNGLERTESFYFNFTEAEIAEMELGRAGGLAAYIQAIIDAKDQEQLIKMFKKLVISAYGVKTQDGRGFIKNDRVREEFMATQAYSDIFMKFAFDADAASKFVDEVTPKETELKVAGGMKSAVAQGTVVVDMPTQN